MRRCRLHRYWLSGLAVLAVLLGLIACSGGPPQSPVDHSGDLAEIQQQVEAQATRLSAFEAQGALAEQVADQGTRIAVLETQVALPPSAPAPAGTATLVPTLAPETPRPLPTNVAPVAGLPTEGTTKGAADAPVTITEYVDYL